MSLELIIFDLDGTLINSIDDLGNAVNRSLSMASMPEHRIDEYYAMVGHGVRNLVRSAIPEEYRQDEELVERCFSEFISYYSTHLDVCTRPYEGIESLLAAIQNKGLKIAVASNKFQAGTELLLHKLFPEIEFSAIYGDRPGFPLKPDPGIVQSIISDSAVEISCPEDLKSKVVMVGDSPTDVRTGLNSGVGTIAVSWGYRSREALLQVGAPVVVDNVTELAEVLGIN